MSEDEVRKGLEKQLGVEFYDPEDPEINVDLTGETVPDAMKHSRIRGISVNDIINECNRAVKNQGNPYRMLIWNCGFVIRQLADRLEKEKHGNPK